MNRRPLLAACLLFLSQAAVAQTIWGGSISLASDHRLRGISRSSEDPSLSAEVHAQSRSGWFAGAWAGTSRVNAYVDTTVDVAASVGLGGAAGDNWSWRGSLAHYQSPLQQRAGWYRYTELTLDVQLRDVLLLSGSWSPDTAGYSPYAGITPRADALAFEVGAQRPLIATLRGHAGVGYREFAGALDQHYWYGSVGAAWSARRWDTDLTYVHPARAARHVSWPGTADRRVVLRLTWNF